VLYVGLRFETAIESNAVMTPTATPITILGKDAIRAAMALQSGDRVSVTGHLETHIVVERHGNIAGSIGSERVSACVLRKGS
jgi:hypothetical protein